MTGTNNKTLLAVCSAIAFTCLFLLSIFNPNSFVGHNLFGRFVLTGDTPSVVRHSKLDSHADPSQKLRVLVGLKLRDEPGLNKLLAEIYDSTSPRYRQYITPDDFAARFSPTVQDVDVVIAHLQSRGLKIVSVSPNRTLIEAEGTVTQLEKVFSVTINQYTLKMPSGVTKQYLSNDRDPALPARLAPIVESIMGLDTFAEFESRLRKQAAVSKPYGFSPQEIATVYDFPTANNAKIKGTKFSGSGKTIAIATAESYNQKDVDAYWKHYNITRTGKLIDVPVGGKSTKANDETTLDLQTASSQAPGADIMMYMGVDPKFTTFTKVFNQVVTDNKADVMSISWGLCEEHTGVRQMKTEHNIFKQAAAQGIAVFAAAGDDGAYDCKHDEEEDGGKDKDGKPTMKPVVKLSVDYPSSDPYVTAVGGTALYSSKGKRISESAWTGGGGGNSDHWPRETWQKGPGVPAGSMRSTSDVALNASPSTAYSFYMNGKWEAWGGTSVSAPAWAALWAVIDEAAGVRIGMPVETLYRVGESTEYKDAFHDITSGDNGDYRGPGFRAGDFWDHPTGWGVPKGESLKDWIVGDQLKKSQKAAAPTTNGSQPDAAPVNGGKPPAMPVDGSQPPAAPVDVSQPPKAVDGSQPPAAPVDGSQPPVPVNHSSPPAVPVNDPLPTAAPDKQ